MRTSTNSYLWLAFFLLACRTRSGGEQARNEQPATARSNDASPTPNCAPEPVELRAPSLHSTPLPSAPVVADDTGDGHLIVARWYDSRVYQAPDAASLVIGYARRGQRVRVRRGANGVGCPADMWYQLVDGGFACAARDFREATVEVPDPVEPHLDAVLPYGYARVVLEGAPQLERLPTSDELTALQEALASGGSFPDLVGERMKGAYFITVSDTLEHGGHRFHRTDAGRFVLAEHAELITPSTLHGAPLSGSDALPLGFVHRPDAVVRCVCPDDEIVVCGRASPFARFRVVDRRVVDGKDHLVGSEGWMIADDDVGIAREVQRPEGVDDDDRWVHIDLSEQTLVAHEGDRAIHATLVSTGKGEHATPTGLWRIDRRHLSTTMSGPDEVKGSYTVSEVPWTMYYDGDFALHGAYWHTEFGRVRSHGCTNIPPADARWLFAWSGPLPAGWHAASNVPGPWVYVTE